MKLFTIDPENNITLYASATKAPTGEELHRFASEKELARLTQAWPAQRLVELWNSFAGVAPFGELKQVQKFMDRKTAAARIWKAIQRLEARAEPDTAPTKAPQAARVAPKRKPAAKTTTGGDGSKKAKVLEMLRAPAGATLKEIMSVTGWMAHSVRGFISGGLGKKMGINVESFKGETGERAYRVPK